MELEGDNKYHLVIHSKGNKACPDLERSIFLLQDANGDIVNGTVLLQYHISSEAEEVELQVYPHGNRKTSTNVPFHPDRKKALWRRSRIS